MGASTWSERFFLGTRVVLGMITDGAMEVPRIHMRPELSFPGWLTIKDVACSPELSISRDMVILTALNFCYICFFSLDGH